MPYFFDPTFVILIPAMIFAFITSASVQSTFSRYNGIPVRAGLTGAQAARMVLDAAGLESVRIFPVAGNLTDHYDPRDRTLHLSSSVYGARSIGAVAVACHESGHALQHAGGYTPLTIRDSIVPVVNFASKATWILIICGLILMTQAAGNIGTLLFDIGVIAFLAVILFHLVTLPVEFNASRRAVQEMRTLGIVQSAEEETGAKKVLRAAAMTYVAALAMAIANLLRILAIRARR